MVMSQNQRGKRLSSGMTGFMRNIFPFLWTVGVGVGMAGIWFETVGEPATLTLKVLGGVLWAGTSILFTAWSRGIYHVWLDGADLIVLGSSRRVRVPLHDIIGMSETRGQRVKTIKLSLRTGSHLGPAIRFIPRHRMQAPFSEHPIIRELKEARRRLAGESGPGELRAGEGGQAL
jgi:hypothetical protein